MTSFPAIVPSSRAFTPGEYPVTSFGAYTGKQNRVRHSNVFIDAQLRLSFIGLSEADMLTIWSHYANKQGTFNLFGLPSQIVEGSSITNYVPSNYLWRYVADGSVEDLPCGGHNVTLTIEAVKVGFSAVIGIERIITLELIAGAGAAGEYIAGISQSVSLSLSAGTASTAIDGLAASITLSLAAGVADGDKSVSGISNSIILGLATGVAAIPTNPIPALSPILWYDFDDAATVTLSGSTITDISDKGSRSWTLTKSATGPVQATWTNNSRKCVDWGSSAHSNYLRNTTTTSTDIAEIYMVVDGDFGSTFPDYNGIISATDDATPTPLNVTGNVGGTGFYSPGSFDAAYLNGSASNTYSSGILPTLNSPTLLRIKKLNDTAVATTLGIQLGRDRTYSRPFLGLIAEVVCFSSVLSSNDRDEVETWLADKWGLTLV